MLELAQSEQNCGFFIRQSKCLRIEQVISSELTPVKTYEFELFREH